MSSGAGELGTQNLFGHAGDPGQSVPVGLAQADTGRDHRSVLHTLLHHGTVVQLMGSTVHVRLKPFDSPRLRRLATVLCDALTTQKAHTLDTIGFLIVKLCPALDAPLRFCHTGSLPVTFAGSLSLLA